MILVVFGCSLLALLFAGYLARYVLSAETGTPGMQAISDAIREGANAFLARQYRTIAMLGILCAVAIFSLYLLISHQSFTLSFKIVGAFLIGAACSLIAGYIGMFISIRANIRTAGATATSVDKALKVALRGGAVSGLTIVAMSLLGVSSIFVLYGGLSNPTEVPLQIVGFGFGASFVALFAQLGGGIYTKAADVGADLVGKVEAGIPEDDPRNPAVIADLVGDNVGDCAGRGADLFESISAENIGAMILGIALYAYFGLGGILFPLVARAFGLLATMAGVWSVRARENEDPMMALNRGYWLTTLLAAIGFLAAVILLLKANLYFFICGAVGLLTALAFVYITQYYTEFRYRPVQTIVQSSQTGPATNIITGLSVAMECTAVPTLVLAGALMSAYYFGKLALPGVPGAGLYGTAIATMGMLAPCAYILAMDTFGPIVDNAGGIIEMSNAPSQLRTIMERFDAVGNTTKALTKGYAVGSAGLSAFLLFRAYLDEVLKMASEKGLEVAGAISVDLAYIPTFIGAFIGVMLVFLFSALAIRAVGRAAYYVIHEVRQQFKEIPGILQGKQKPLYGRCVDIVTAGALKEMLFPGLLPVVVPAFIGISFRWLSKTNPLIGAEAVAGLLMVGTVAGILLATMMNNGGAAWDNAKKFIEAGNLGGKGSDPHKASVVGDTVGDPFKDTAGPSLHVLVKLLSTVSLVLAPLFL